MSLNDNMPTALKLTFLNLDTGRSSSSVIQLTD